MIGITLVLALEGSQQAVLATHTSVMAAQQGPLLQEPNVHDSKFSKELSKRILS